MVNEGAYPVPNIHFLKVHPSIPSMNILVYMYTVNVKIK